jgi:hypothetical protein
MSQVVSWDDFIHDRFEKTGETIVVINAEGRVVTTIEPRQTPLGGVENPFHNIDFGAPIDAAIDGAALIIEEREYERSGKKHGV